MEQRRSYRAESTPKIESGSGKPDREKSGSISKVNCSIGISQNCIISAQKEKNSKILNGYF
ncbi:hypothetical protein [Leptospira alexanderi]|uniref:Uncharacterized protein n=1 Tax=Leptospira alexanderi serovar Manhao 3 str. L 60 TaxID=1049759 RepID=V6IBZ8_9LEPT|nr:hypothetical protein [Leptospira alexanderi]EQA61693.1 hypothetical protein LEP1GSC062_1968 [Leptospira alexanderi serovar Manhao 3 str. L 60]